MRDYGAARTIADGGTAARTAADARANLGINLPIGFQATGSNLTDFSSNGSYVLLASVSFVAAGTKADLKASVWFNHANASTTQFYAYIELYDSTAAATAGSGAVVSCSLQSTYAPMGALAPFAVLGSLTVGRTYVARLWVQRAQANGSTAIFTPCIGGINL